MRKNLLFVLLGLIASSTMTAQVIFNVLTPSSVAGGYDFTYADSATLSWTMMKDLTKPENAVTGSLAFVSDGSSADSLGCDPIVNTSEIAGKIAVVYRGTCQFGVKAKRAQDAGAIGVIIINHSAGLINMSAADSGALVTIPVIFIENSTGALIRPSIENGSATAYIGARPEYPVDLGSTKGLSIWPPSSALPVNLIETFNYAPGIFVANIGSEDQTGATVTATINNGTADVYTNTQTLDFSTEDTVFAEFPSFTPPYGAGTYTVTYTISAKQGDTDDYPSDNVITGKFYITESIFTYAPMNSTIDAIKPNIYTRSGSDPAIPAEYCLTFKNAKASKVFASGLSFGYSGSSTANPNTPVTDQFVNFVLYEWNDAFTDMSNSALVTFDALNEIAQGDYTFESDLRQTIIYVPFNQAVQLVDNQRYLACFQTDWADHQFSANSDIDYEQSQGLYSQPITPIRVNETWYSGGFSNATMSIGLHTTPVNVSVSENSVTNAAPAYPMPAKQFVNIPLNTEAKSAAINITDITGKIVATLDSRIENGAKSLRINTTDISNGSYFLNVKFDNGSTSNFRVVISH